MTILYKPVLIESAEQAEALPIGTIAALRGEDIARKSGPGQWEAAGSSSPWSDSLVRGWTALVPIEAEEEKRDHPAIMLPTYPPKYPQQTRLVTPWEDE